MTTEQIRKSKRFCQICCKKNVWAGRRKAGLNTCAECGEARPSTRQTKPACSHGYKRRYNCRVCEPHLFCEHGKKLKFCSICDGSYLCPHERQKNDCPDCKTAEQLQDGTKICRICCKTQLNHNRRRVGVTTCAQCDSESKTRTEHVVREMLLPRVNHPPSAADDAIFGGADCDADRRRPDLLWLATDRAIKVGIDEDGGHPNNPSQCELAKVCDQHTAFQKLIGPHVPTFVLKFNPDRYDGARVTLKDRVKALADRINALLTADMMLVDPRRPIIEYFFYHSSCHCHIYAAKANPDAVLVGGVAPPPPLLYLPCEQ